MAKLVIEFISGNAGGVVEGSLSVDTGELEGISCKNETCILSFPGVNIYVPVKFCDKVHAAVEENRS